VDFVLRRGKSLVPIEVKSAVGKARLPGMEAFCREYSVKRQLLVGAQGVPLAEFLGKPAEHWLCG
jgi:uncharacterized protein